MKLSVIGIGAAGNKAAIKVLENGIVSKEYVKLLNTTTKDIPEKYKQDGCLVFKFSSELGGCGKEPKRGYRHMLKAIQNKEIDFANIIPEDTQEVIIISSTGGGTGCGATPLVAKYFISLNIPVHIFALLGFGDEPRELSNTLSFFKNMDDNVILHTLRNEDFLDYTKDYNVAEEAANDCLAKQVEILTGDNMIPSYQNIDDTDMYKVSTTAGYMDIEHIPLVNIKNEDLFNKAIKETMDNVKCMEFEPTAKRLAVIINASDKTKEAIDNTLKIIKRYIGEPFEIFRHIQYNPEESAEYIDIIASGMDFPKNGIIEISKKCAELKAKSKSASDSFNDIFESIDMDDDDEFDMDIKKTNDPKDVFNFFRDEVTNKTKTIVVKDNDIKEY